MGELREHLPRDALLVQYLLAGDRLLAWAVDADVVDGSVHPVDADQIAGHVRRVHAASAGQYLPGDPEQSRQELGRLLLGPVKEHLARQQRLVIVPSGPLNLLPFTVLPHGEDILGASHVVSILPATALLPRLAGERAETGEVLVVGDPSFAAETCLPRLPGTRMEALLVAKQHGTVPLLGEQATEAAVTQRLRNAGLVHLATHGLISEIAPTASALALQGTDRLTVADLAGLRFGADLVVLSACDTGRGDTTIGGDVVGLARQLLAAREPPSSRCGRSTTMQLACL
jgi:CHAT domain-containing protein